MRSESDDAGSVSHERSGEGAGESRALGTVTGISTEYYIGCVTDISVASYVAGAVVLRLLLVGGVIAECVSAVREDTSDVLLASSYTYCRRHEVSEARSASSRALDEAAVTYTNARRYEAELAADGGECYRVVTVDY